MLAAGEGQCGAAAQGHSLASWVLRSGSMNTHMHPCTDKRESSISAPSCLGTVCCKHLRTRCVE